MQKVELIQGTDVVEKHYTEAACFGIDGEDESDEDILFVYRAAKGIVAKRSSTPFDASNYFKLPFNVEGDVLNFSLSPDSKMLAIWQQFENGLHIKKVGSRDPLRRLDTGTTAPFPGRVEEVIFSPSGLYIAALAHQSQTTMPDARLWKIAVWSVASAGRVTLFHDNMFFKASCTELAFCPTDERILCRNSPCLSYTAFFNDCLNNNHRSYDDTDLAFHNEKTPSLILPAQPCLTKSFAWMPDGKGIVRCESTRVTPSVRLHLQCYSYPNPKDGVNDNKTYEFIPTAFHTSRVYDETMVNRAHLTVTSIMFNRSGSRLIADPASKDPAAGVHVWDAASGHLLAVLGKSLARVNWPTLNKSSVDPNMYSFSKDDSVLYYMAKDRCRVMRWWLPKEECKGKDADKDFDPAEYFGQIKNAANTH